MNKNLSVLHISNRGLGNGGVSTVIFSIVSSLHDSFNFSCVVFDEICSREKLFTQYGPLFRIKFCYTPHKWYNKLSILFRPLALSIGTYRLCRTHKFQVIHCHNGYAQWACLLAAKLAGVPIRIAHSHNTTAPVKYAWWKKNAFNFYNACARFLINRLATVRLGCSRQACIDFFGRKVPAHTVYNSVDLTLFDAKQHTPYTGKRFIHVGRFSFAKNQEFVVDTFSHLYKQCPDFHLTLVGTGNTTRIQQQIEHYGLQQAVTLVDGQGANIPQLYANADYMIFPSRFEGFGIVLIEAQAMGVPCFVSQAVQPDADAGLLVWLDLQAGPKHWADAIMAYIRQHPYAQTVSAARLAQYDVKEICQQYARIYRGKQ